ncbi:MAG: BamA/TamA family outer membrane protein [Ideonella sp.]|nr:BamA/TamA family outer membrane protein [Ideonella sp.]MCC7458224.1 BamA/TamA family outer membrane protein [Nitrospira sp.]
MTRRLAAPLGALLATIGLCGCAGLLPDRSAAPAADTAAAAPSADTTANTPAANATALHIDAPAPLRDLLQRHLDIARLSVLGPQEQIDDTEWARLVAAAPAQARELLQTEGYFAPEVRVRREPGPPAVVTVQVEPGPQVQVQEVALTVRGALRTATDAGDADAREQIRALHAWWPLPPGEAFRNAGWSAAKTGALTRLRAAGYASASIAASAAEVDVATHTTKLNLTLDSGPLFRAGELRVLGVVKQDDTVVRNLAGFGPGTPLTEQLLFDYQDRLRKSGLFDTTVISFDSDPAVAAASPVTVQVHELPLQSLTLGVGASANTGPRATFEHTHRRIFGYAATVHNKVEYGRDRQAWEGELSTHPGERFYRNLVGTQVERLRTDLDEVLSQRVRVGRTQDTQRIERLYFLGLDRSVQTTATVHKEARAPSVQYHLVWRDLDSVILPTRGITFSGQGGVGWATSNYADNGAFTRAYGRITGYLPLGRGWYATARVEAGQIFKRDAVALPDALAFRAGGDDSVRGYAYRTLAPTDVDGVITGGNVLATASVEIARPFAKLPSVWWAAFVDAGRAADSWKGFSPALGYGLGLRWRSPVGPLRFDLAYGEEVRRFRVHVSVGIAF